MEKSKTREQKMQKTREKRDEVLTDGVEFIGKFLGFDKIATAEASPKKTFLGKDKMIFTYEGVDDVKESYPMRVVEQLISDSPTDLTSLRDKRVIPVLEEILAVLTESELSNADMNYAVSKITELINNAIQRADDILWGKAGQKITLMDAETVLKSKKEKHE